MLTAKEMEKIRLEDAKKISFVSDKAEDVARSKMASIQEKSQVLKKKIQELADKKHELFTLPSSKAETLALAKEAHRENRRKFFFEELLLPELKGCQNGHNIFLNPDRARMFFDRNGWRLVYWLVTEKDIEEAAKMLPDIGLSSEERDAEIKKIDADMATLEDQIEKELRKL